MHLVRYVLCGRRLCGFAYGTGMPEDEYKVKGTSKELCAGPCAQPPATASRATAQQLTPSRRDEIARSLRQRLEAMSIEELRRECVVHGADTLLTDQSLRRNRAGLRSALLNLLLEPWEVNNDTDETIDAWLAAVADQWPSTEPRIQPDMTDTASHAAAIDVHGDGPWSLGGCGVEIKVCEDVPAKGRGAFATRAFNKGAVVGIYTGMPRMRRA